MSAGAVAGIGGLTPAAEEATRPLPTMRLGPVEVSRLILGSNPFYGFAHKMGKLGEEMKAWYTDERIVAVLDEAAAQGMTAVASPPYDRWLRLWARYREQGGRLRTWIAQPDPSADQMEKAIEASVKGGAHAVFVQGGRVDEQFAKGDLDRLLRWVKLIKGLGVPAGMASHRPDVHLEAERRGFPTDFYFQCFYNPHHETYNPEDREQAVAAIRQIDKPVVGYKILAAGRLGGKEGFTFAFRRLRRKDGVCVGMFPKHQPDQVQANAELTRTLASA